MTAKLVCESIMAREEKSKETATNISPGVEERVVEVSLENPYYGPQRLVHLLEEEGISLSVSSIYTILKRNNLQNRTLRFSKIEELSAAKVVSEPPDTKKPPVEEEEPEPPPVPAHTIEIKPESPESPPVKSHSRFSGWRFRSYALPSLLVLGMVGYFCVSAALELLRAGREPAIEPEPEPAEAISKAETTARPLEDFSIIYERNLFGASQGQVPVPQEEVSVEDVPAADKSLGLKLVGTVAGDDSATSFAFIDNIKTRKQELYHEGDKAGDVLIKKILRNKVIVDAGRGEELLALDLEETGKKIEFSPPSQPPVRGRRTASRAEARRFDRAEVEAALQNVDQVIKDLNITPFVRAGKPTGFRIGKLPADSILVAMGLRNGDLITGVNDQDITSPDQAAEFFQTLKQGGDVTIKVRKGRGVRMRGRVIHLKIE
jgi:general secretion pathway protein C